MSGIKGEAGAPALHAPALPTPALHEPVTHEPVSQARRELTMVGIGLMVLGVTVGSMFDVTGKMLAVHLPAVQILWLRFLLLLVFLAPFIIASGPRKSLNTRRLGLHLIRGFLVTANSLLYIYALGKMQLAETNSIFFSSPIIVMGLSVLILKEKVTALLWLSALLAMIGLLMIVRPGTAAFQPAALLVIASALFWSFAVIITRKMADEAPLTMLTLSGIVGFLILSFVVPFHWAPLTWSLAPLILGMALASAGAHWLVILAYRHAAASTLAPFTYLPIVTATILGYLFFAHTPDIWTIAGAAIIVASGLFIAQREHVRRSLPQEG